MSIKKEIKSAVQDYERAKLARAHLDKITPRIQQTTIELYQLEKELDQTNIHINNIMAFSLKELFSSSLGNKEQQLESERQRYLETVLRYRELKKSLQLLEFERDVLADKVLRLPELKSRLNILLRSREQLLDESDVTLKRAIGRVDRRIMQQMQLKAKTEEAKKHCYKVIEYVYRVSDYFEATHGWGFLQAKRYSETYKIDQAETYLSKIKQQLITLEDELEAINQIGKQEKFRLDIARRFASLYIDNLILDWIISGKIKHAEVTLDNVRDRIELVLEQLKLFARQTQEKMNDLEADKRKLLLIIE
ncbi:MAG TPA: hypothetical protein VJ953_22680 [Saprospiraceae bacterium]|nr:hypothetical protein [Saprospiraceae bacterium]